MSKEIILISDLTHTSTGAYATNFIPYPIGCIKSYFKQYSKYKDNFDVHIFKDPQKFITSFLKHKPQIIGLSNYIWNKDLAYECAKEIKKRAPNTLIIFGGPNFPIDDQSREEWLKEHPAIDVYVIGEGEEPFTQLVDSWFESHNIDAVKKSGVIGCYSIIDNKLCKSGDFSPRVDNLDKIPSPYLKGYLDEFLDDPKLAPLLESNRGCPFSCTFCVDGMKERSKVYNKSVERFEEELEYIAQRNRGKVLTLADLNFGMYGRDIDISESISRVKKKYGYPYYIQVSTGKNNKPRVLKCAEILEGSMSLAASVQSLDKQVLTNIKRDNISEQQLVEVTKAGNKLSANTYSEVILALPGDSKQKHFETVLKLADAEMNLISMYQCMILEGSELGSKYSKEFWKIKTKYRVLPKCFGIYDFDGKEILAAEIEEISVETNTLSIEDYYQCRTFALTVGLFYQDRILFELYKFLKNFNIKPSDVLPILNQKRMMFSSGISKLFESFDDDTRKELWDDKEELKKYVKSDKSVIERYVKGELGVNVLFKHRAIAALNLIEEIHEAAFNTALEILQKKDYQAYQMYKPYLLELKIFSICRKQNVFDYTKRLTHYFNYDFQKLVETNFDHMPEKLEKPMKIIFYSTDKQKDMITSQLAERGSDINGIGKILSRTIGTMFLRSLIFDNTYGINNNQEDLELNSSPGEFV